MLAMSTDVSDFKSNKNDQIAHAADAIGRSDARRRVFEAVYRGKRKVKTVREIADTTRLSRKQVLNAGKPLVHNAVVEQTKQDGDTAYAKHAVYGAHKATILRLASDPLKRAALPTKTNPAGRATSRLAVQTIKIKVPRNLAPDVQHVTVDDIASFSKVRKVQVSDVSITPMLENTFKQGIQRIIDEPGKFKDWGGEKNDLWTSRLVVKRTRVPTAFAFKGPGMTGTLTPGKLGKNGDQLQRLMLDTEADVFLVQYWSQVAQSVHEQMYALAIARSILRGGASVTYGIIDGTDSARLIKAYPDEFPKGTK